MKTKLLVVALMLASAPAPAHAQGNERNSPWWCPVDRGGSPISVFLPFCYMGR